MFKFADALREREYFGVAIDYLEQVKPSQLSAESRAALPLEKATTYSRAATSSRDLREADSLLAAALKAIEGYQPKGSNDKAAAKVARLRGDLHFNRARITKARATVEKPSRTQREQLLAQTRSFLNDSGKAYDSATKSLKSTLKNFQVDPEDSSTASELKRLRVEYTYLQTRGPMLKEQLAANLTGQKKEREKLLKEAASEAKKVWEKYRDYHREYPPAIQSGLTAAKCYQGLGELESSQQIVSELFTLDRSVVSVPIRRETLSIAATNWQSIKPFPWETVVAETEATVKTLTPAQALHPQWQAVQLSLAQALHEKSNSLAGKKDGVSKRESKTASEAAIKLANMVAQTAGDNRERAISFLQKWGSGSEVSDPATTQASKTKAKSLGKSFDEAVQLGKASLPNIESTARQIRVLDQKIQRAKSDPQKQKLQTEADKLKQQQIAETGTALDLFGQALRLNDESVTREEVNNVRYLQCYCYFARQQYIESSVIAKFLLDKYPNVSGTRQAAAILLRNQLATLNETSGDKTFEKEQLILSCKAILARYPDTTEASAAAARLAWLALGDKDNAQAKTWLDKIPSGDPQRTGLALSLGRRHWFAWSKANADQPGSQKEQLDAAKQYLTEGVTNSDPETLSYAAAEGALLLTQALLAAGDVDGAIRRLESDEIAPLKLVEPAHRALTSTGRINLYHQQTVTTAIKGYMAAMARSSSGQSKWIDKSGQVIAGLQKRLQASGKPDDSKRLIAIYRLLSQRLIQQFESLAAGQQRVDFGVRLASFLTEIEKQSQDATTVVWAGATLLSVANVIQQDGANAQSEAIYAQAVSALDRAEELGFGDADNADSMNREIKRQRALAQRGAGNFDAALQQFTQLLTAKAGDLNIQLDAALTLQQQAAAQKDVNGFATSILGSTPVADPKTKRKQNVIWGWRKLVQITRGKSQFQDAFYQSLYRMIEARFEMGRINQSSEGIGKALKELDNWQQRNPNFDNGTWKQKFAQLRQRIQKQ